MTDVVEINDIEALRSYQLAWSALHAETPRASFFQTLEWLTCYWKHQSQGRLRVLIVRANGRPIGIVPLVEIVEHGKLGPVRVLTYPLDNWGAWYGPIGANQTATLTLAMKHLASVKRTWDVFEPRWMAHEGSDRGRTERAMRLAGLTAEVRQDDTTSIIECDAFDDWEAYLTSRRSKVRHEMRRQRRQLERDHWVEHLRHRPEAHRHGDGDPRWDLFERCLEVSRKSWQASSDTGNTLCDHSVEPMIRDAHEQAALLGMLDMNLLTVDGQAAAFFYAYLCRGEVYGLRMGYDPTVARGAGSVLLAMVIEDSFAVGDTRIDLGPGPEDYKRRVRTTVEASSRLTHIARGAWRSRAVDAARRVAKRFRQAS